MTEKKMKHHLFLILLTRHAMRSKQNIQYRYDFQKEPSHVNLKLSILIFNLIFLPQVFIFLFLTNNQHYKA